MRKRYRLTIAAALLAACGTSSPVPASCSHGADYCYDYPVSATGALTLQACVGVGGTGGQYQPGTCTGVDLVGTCTGSTNVLITGTLIRYYSPAYTAQSAWETCSLVGGAFTPQ